MSIEKKHISKSTTSDGYSYLTKRMLVSKARSAGKIAAKNAMQIMGYVVTVKDGWIVKQYENGTIEQIEQLEIL